MNAVEIDAVNFETMKHMEKVRNNINKIVIGLLNRAEKHDQTKIQSPEMEVFAEHTANLAALTYGSPEYDAQKLKLQGALTHHYANNRHHPEHFKNGIEEMNLMDLIEMFCDWKAATERHTDGNLRKSIENNGKRFEMSPQLIRIFENSVDLLQ